MAENSVTIIKYRGLCTLTYLKESIAVIRGRTIVSKCKGNVHRARTEKCRTREISPFWGLEEITC